MNLTIDFILINFNKKRPFDQDTYEDDLDKTETLDEEGQTRIRLKVSK